MTAVIKYNYPLCCTMISVNIGANGSVEFLKISTHFIHNAVD